MAASDAERWPRGAHARPFDLALVDAVAQRDVRVAVRAHVAHRGEAGAQREPRILGAADGGARDRDAERPVAVVRGVAGEVRVRVNQPRQASAVPEVEWRDSRRGSGADRRDHAIVIERHHLVFQRAAALDIEQLAAAHRAGCGKR